MLLQRDDIEIDELAEFKAGQFQIRQQLLLVDWVNVLGRLEFNDDQSRHDEVCSKTLVEFDAVVDDRNRHLSLDDQTALLQFMGQRNLIDRFEQARAELRVNLEGAVHDDLPDFVFSRRAVSDAAYAGTPMVPRLPSLVQIRFWIVDEKVLPNAPDFRRLFTQLVDVPSGTNLSTIEQAALAAQGS